MCSLFCLVSSFHFTTLSYQFSPFCLILWFCLFNSLRILLNAVRFFRTFDFFVSFHFLFWNVLRSLPFKWIHVAPISLCLVPALYRLNVFNLAIVVSQKLFCVLIADYKVYFLVRQGLLQVIFFGDCWKGTPSHQVQHRHEYLVRWIHHNFERNKAKSRANPKIKPEGASASGGQLRWSQLVAPGLHNNHVIQSTLTTQNSNTNLQGKTDVYIRKQNLHNYHYIIKASGQWKGYHFIKWNPVCCCKFCGGP